VAVTASMAFGLGRWVVGLLGWRCSQGTEQSLRMPSATAGNKHGFKARLLDYPLAICRSHDDLKFIAKIVLNFKNPSSTVHIDNKKMYIFHSSDEFLDFATRSCIFYIYEGSQIYESQEKFSLNIFQNLTRNVNVKKIFKLFKLLNLRQIFSFLICAPLAESIKYKEFYTQLYRTKQFKLLTNSPAGIEKLNNNNTQKILEIVDTIKFCGLWTLKWA